LAKQKDLNELKAISNSISFVEAIAKIIHQLQSERGASCIYLASNGQVFHEERTQILAKIMSWKIYLLNLIVNTFFITISWMQNN